MDMEEIILIIDDVKERMEKSYQDLLHAFTQIRSGRATSGLVDDIKVDVYGQLMPLNQVATINIPEARLITIDVWDKSKLHDVDRAISASGRNLNPQNDGSLIRIALPDLTEERRKELVKVARQKVEDHKVSIRNIRRDGNDQIKKLKSEGVSEDEIHARQEEIQKITDNYISRVEDVLTKKEKEIMTV